MLRSDTLERMFNRSLASCFSKQKLALVFPSLALCGFVTVICRALSRGAGQWIQMSLGFLPIFLCGGLLLGMGIVLTRLYREEVRGEKIHVLKIIKESSSLFWSISYLTVPLIFTYLILWMVLGIFYLLRAIPAIGEFVGSALAFGPFLLVLGSLLLSLFTLVTLFFLTPAAALKSELSPEFSRSVFIELKKSPFLSFVLPLIALFPLLLTLGFLCLSAVVTNIMYFDSTHGVSIFLKWLFIMVPFSLLLTPSVIFFFQFATEAHVLIKKLPAKS